MKVTLEKNIELHSANMYLAFEKEVERNDIKEYLNGKIYDNPVIDNRVMDFLKNIKILDEKYQLTAYGGRVKESGKILQREEGKYQIWHTRNDDFFGTRIFYFKRIQPDSEGLRRLNWHFDTDGHFLLPTTENKYAQLKLIPPQDLAGQYTHHKAQITVRWVWDDLNKSHFVYYGQINLDRDKFIRISNEAISSNMNLSELIREILPEWNQKYRTLKVRFDSLSEESKRTFEDNYQSEWRGFKVNINQLPLAPYDTEDTTKWRNWLINQELKKNYLNPQDFEQLVNRINRKNSFAEFANQLNKPAASEYLKSMMGLPKSEKNASFWHLAAPIDLSPELPEKTILKSFHYKDNDEISFRDIAQKIGGMAEKNSATVFYYDRYVITRKQQESVSCFLNSFRCSKKILITDLAAENRSDYLSKSDTGILQKDLNVLFGNKKRSQHDRYIILAEGNDLSVWQISNSIDYIRFNDKQHIHPETKGKILQSVSFNLVNMEMLKPELINYIKNEIKNG